ncbi:MAG: ATP-dependent helicase [Acidobacteriota bacterium]
MGNSDNSPVPTPAFHQDLNKSQREVVLSEGGPHLVVAGPGSGKTRTLVYRVAHLVSSGVEPESILLLTFTRKSAREMLRRAESALDDRCRRVAGGTFHSFAHGQLRRFARTLGYAPNFTILDGADAADLVGVLRTEGGYADGGRRFPRKRTLSSLFSRHVNTGRPLEELVTELRPSFLEDVPDMEALLKAYRQRKKSLNLLDYDDLLVELRRLLRENQDIRRALARRYHHVLVDEYQDTNRLQAEIAALLASVHRNLLVVGDDAQSIYSFRGADFRNIMDFPQRLFPDATITLLERNYRSTQPILDLANAVLANAGEKYDKALFTRREGAHRPQLVEVPDDYGQSRFVVQRILALREEEGIELSQIAVLARAGRHTNELEIELANANIPFRKYGGQRFVEAAHVKDVCALLRISANPLDDLAWNRVLQFFDGVGAKTSHRLAKSVLEAGGDTAPLLDPKVAKRVYGASLQRLVRLLEALRDDEDADSGDERSGNEAKEVSTQGTSVAERIEAAVDFYQPLLRRKFDDAPRRAQDLETITQLAQRYRSLESFLSDIALDPPERAETQAADQEDEFLTLSTVHSAKGLEWKAVFVLSLNSGTFPSARSLERPDEMEEERRLFYVAITRAEDHLFLLRPQQLPRQFRFAEPSPLLTEIQDLHRLTEAAFFDPEAQQTQAWPGDADDTYAEEEGDLMRRLDDYFSS